jgi:hypothetical protein
VAAIAEKLAYDKDLIPDRIDFGADLIARLQDSKNKHRIVVLILDPWTVQLPEYYTRMKESGEQNLWKCVVVVPWNEDEETQQQAEILGGVIKELFSACRQTSYEPRFALPRSLLGIWGKHF